MYNLQMLDVTVIYFRRLPYIMTNDKSMTMLSAKIIKQYKLSKYIRNDPLFLLLEGHMHQNQFVYLHFCYTFVEMIFKMTLNTLVAKMYRYFNFQLCRQY